MSLPRTALLVDDEEQLLRLMTRILERAGVRVLCAANADEARRLFRENTDEIEIALLDVLMPGGGGAAVLLPEFLTERPELDIVLTSGDALPETLEIELGRIGGRFLRKPFVSKSLLRILEPTAVEQTDPVGPSNLAGPGGG